LDNTSLRSSAYGPEPEEENVTDTSIFFLPLLFHKDGASRPNLIQMVFLKPDYLNNQDTDQKPYPMAVHNRKLPTIV
jgi:hypothetical protein